MVKVKAQAKVAVKAKSKTTTSVAADLGRPADKVKMAGKKEANDAVKKSSRGSAKATDEALENKIKTVAKLPKAAPHVTEIAKAVMAVKEPSLVTAKLAKGKAIKEGRGQVKDAEKLPLAPQDLEARRMRLKSLIVQGKERGYLTYAEINDHLPDDMLDAEQIENIISMINDVGISVYDEAPDAETLLMSETAPTVADEDVVEEAEAALSTVDSEFGRTTDPVRMYMREMGSVELLTRESEIEIAKRIEDGLKHMIQAISACPTTIAGILDLANKVTRDEMRIDELVDGLLDPNAQEMVGEEISDESLEQELGAENAEDEDIAAIASANLLKLKNDALVRFAVIQQAYIEMQKALAKKGSGNKAYKDIQENILSELMAIRFSAKMVEKLCDTQRGLVDEMRGYERKIMELCVTKAGMPRNHFIKAFPGNESNFDWVEQEVAVGKSYSQTLGRYQPAIVEQQQNLLTLQKRVGIPLKELKEINRRMSTGEAKARRAKREMTEANLRLVISIAKKIYESWFTIP